MGIGALGVHGQIVHRRKEAQNVLGRECDFVTAQSLLETESIVPLMEVAAKSRKSAIATPHLRQVEYLISIPFWITNTILYKERHIESKHVLHKMCSCESHWIFRFKLQKNTRHTVCKLFAKKKQHPMYYIFHHQFNSSFFVKTNPFPLYYDSISALSFSSLYIWNTKFELLFLSGSNTSYESRKNH